MSIFRLLRRRRFKGKKMMKLLIFLLAFRGLSGDVVSGGLWDFDGMKKGCKAKEANNTRSIFRVLEFYLKFKSSRFLSLRLTA